LSPEEKKVYNLLGITTKSGKLVSGEFSTEKAVKEHKAALVVVAEDASDNTKKMFTNMCTYYKVPIYYFGIKDDLGHAMGKEFRASLAVLDKGLADAIEKQLKMMQDRIGGSMYGQNEDI
jgi:ribosomal protein L7Ae-like RNA K-turn-binding protein